MLRVENVSKTYRTRHSTIHALRDLSLEIERGTFVTVTGPSGSGKTTLLLTLGGLIHPTSGRVVFDGVDICGLSEQRLAHYRSRNVGFVLQTFNLVPYLNALENVMVPMMFSRNGQGERREGAEALLERVGLGDRAEHLPRELSVGQQQRVAIARALCNSPDVILADEPTGNLDPGLAVEIMGVLRDLNGRDGRTVVVVTHSPDAARMGDRRLHLIDGACASE